MASALEHSVETTWINSFAEAGYTIHVPASVSLQMKAAECDLADINYVLRMGRVVGSDAFEANGVLLGLWEVVDKTVDDELMRLTVSVRSTEYDVDLIEVLKLRKSRARREK